MRAATWLSISASMLWLATASNAAGPANAQRWLQPSEPRRLFGNSYAVGFGDLSVGMIRTSAGLILIDGGVPQAPRAIEANLAKLGFSIRDVKLILSTEPHSDHAGGIAGLARDSGATVMASAPAARVLRTGRADPADPQAAWLDDFPAVARLHMVRDRQAIRLGDVTVIAVATPGHTMGSMSWRWQSCEGRQCRSMVFASSLNAVAADGYRFSSPAGKPFVAAFRRSFARMRALPCDMLTTSHPELNSGGGCRGYADRAEARLNARLREETGK